MVRTYVALALASYVQLRQKEACPFLRFKIAILDKLRTGQTRSSIEKEYGVGCATVISPKNNEEKLRPFASTMDSMEVSQEGTEGDSRICLIDASSGMKDKKKAQQLLYS